MNAGRPLILIRKNQAVQYVQGDVTEKVPGPESPERLPSADFARNDAWIEHIKGTLSEVSYPPHSPVLHLHAQTLHEALGPEPDAETLRTIEAEVVSALAQLEAEIHSGQLGASPMLVRGRPLADWLPLEEVARLLREGARLSHRRGGSGDA